MAADPKWLEVLKASGWQMLAVSGALSIVFYLIHINIVPTPSKGWMIVMAFGLALSTCLTLTSIFSGLTKFLQPKVWISHWHTRRNVISELKKYLPFMNEREKEIIAYLLHHNEQTFTCAMDGGYANTLISRGIVIRMLRPGQSFSPEDMPCAIPADVWKVLDRNRQAFPYIPAENGAHPWRISWMLR